MPFLPFAFDKPVEEATEWVFHKAFETFGGPDAVGHKPEPATPASLLNSSLKGAGKEKEL